MASSNGNGSVNGHSNGHAEIDGLTDRLPPHNIQAEEAVLGSILLDNSVLPGVMEILPTREHFYRAWHQVIYKAMCDLHDWGVPVDAVTLAEELSVRDQFKQIGGDETLARIVESTPHAVNALYYAQIVRQKSAKRLVIDQTSLWQRDAYSDSYTAEDLVERMQADISSAADARELDGAEEASPRPWPDEPDPIIWHGIAGEIVRLIDPHTESDPLAILTQFLAAFGNIVGRHPCWRVEATRHGCNLFLCLVGISSKARKGTSWDQVQSVVKGCDPSWIIERVQGGLSTGEGLIWTVRDAISRREKVGNVLGYRDVETDPGVSDKRVLFFESEFGATLTVLNRKDNTLRDVLRQAWDGSALRSSTKNSPARATGAHVSVVGHITSDELHRLLTHTDAANGFANRFLWLCTRRSKLLPHGGRSHTINWTSVQKQLIEAIQFAQSDPGLVGGLVLVRDDAANHLWHSLYGSLSEPRAGLLGAVTSRAEAQVMRLACIYALLDASCWIRETHLRAGLALWKYCEQSAAYIFGDSMGVPEADRVHAALLEAGDEGLLQGEIRRKVFNGREPKAPPGGLSEILNALARAGLVTHSAELIRGRPFTRWRVTRCHKEGS